MVDALVSRKHLAVSAPPVDFEFVFQNLQGAYLILTPALMIVAVSDSYLHAVMRKREDLLGRYIFDAFPDNPSDPKATGVNSVRGSLQRAIATKEEDTLAVQRYDIVNPITGKFEERYWSPVNRPILGDSGEVRYIIHRVQDVTEFVLLKQEKMIRDIAEGRGTDELVGAEVYLRAQEIQAVNRRMEQERKNLEEELHQAQKMEAIGNLTGGMAHDFNNLLGIIVGNLDNVIDSLTDTNCRQAVQTSIDAAIRGSDLTRRLLAFARKQPLQPQRVQVNDLIKGIARLLGRTLREDIEIKLRLADGVWPVVVDPIQLEAAITNLSTNGRDAMPRGGDLSISTRNYQLDDQQGSRHVELKAGSYVLIEVTDTGSGIEPHIIKRIFEPFFTTKEVGKGSGLGLSMVFGFIKQSGGHVEVWSEIGTGTTFRLYLPRAQTAAAVSKNEKKAPRPMRGGQETILVVEDNADMRQVAVRHLTDLGYRVYEAENATAAVEHLVSGNVIDLLFTDIVMPGKINGVELAREAMSRWPNLRVILTSGFPEQHRMDQNGNMKLTGLKLLNKPYRKEDLAAALREVFDET